MYVYPVTFHPASGKTFDGALESDVSLQNASWNLTASADGNEYSAFPAGNAPVGPAPSWSAIPNFTGETSALSQPIIGPGGYFTPTTGVTCILNGAGTNGSSLPAGWTWNGVTLSYDGVSVNGSPTTGLSFTATVTATGNTYNSAGTFSIQGAGGASDTFAPTMPTSQSGSVNGSVQPVLVWDAQSDPSPPPANSGDFTGMEGYVITRNGSPLTNVPVPGSSGQFRAQFTSADIGSPAVAGSTVQSGSAATMSAGGLDFFGTSDQGQTFSLGPITGSFTIRCRLNSLTGPQQFSKFGFGVSPTLNAADARVCAVWTPPTAGGGHQITVRSQSGGTTTVVGSIAGNYSLPERGRFVGTYSGSWTLAFQTSPDGVTWTTVGTATGISMPQTVNLFLLGSAHQATGQMQAQFDEICVTQDPQLSYTDTTAAQGANPITYNYTIASEDNAGNVSSAVSLAITLPGNNPVFGWKVTGNALTDLSGNIITNFRCLAVTGLEIDSPGMWDGFYNTTPTQWAAIKAQANYKGVRIPINGWAARTNQKSNGGVFYVDILTRLRDYITGAGMFIIFDNHWDCPAAYNGGRANGQPGYMDATTGPATITVLANLCKNNPATGIEVFNELFGNNGTDDGSLYGQNGSGGTTTPFYVQTAGKGNPVNSGVNMQVAGHQQLLNAARTAGFNGPVFCGCPSFNSNMGKCLAMQPTDSLNPQQVVATIHYANGNDAQYATVLAASTGRASGMPIAMTEYYTVNGRGSGNNTGYNWAESNHISLWQWGAQNWGGTTTSNLATGTAGQSPALATAGAFNSNASLCQGYSWRFNAASIAFPGFPQ